jgi:hypothetical protein
MSRHFWEDELETFVIEAALNATEEANFNASTAFVVVGANLLSYEIPEGYQPAGEGWEHAVGEGDTYYYQPCLKGVTRTWGAVTDGWSMIPCVIRLTMDTFELVDIIDLAPSEPTITNYRDASLRAGEPYFSDGLENLPDFAAWGRIGDCAHGSSLSPAGGTLHAILRVGDWLIPQISNSNQMYAYNLDSETFFRLEGWDETPAQLLLADPQDGITFTAHDHQRHWYNVVCSIGGDKVLILHEVQDRESSVVSDFINTKTPSATVGSETISDYFRAKWVNASGTTSAEYSGGDIGDWYDDWAYNWDLPDLYCGDLFGEPWGAGPGKPPYSGGGLTRSQATLESEFVTAVEIDLDALCATPRFISSRTASVTVELQIYEFPASGSPAYVSTLYTWDDTTEAQDPIIRGATEYTITSTTIGALDVVDAPADADNYVLDIASDSSYYRRRDSDFSFGAGVMLHSVVPSAVTGGDRYIAQSEDINNCPGPDGPALFKGEVDSGGIKHSNACLLTVLAAPIAATPLLPAIADWSPCHIVNDGTVAISLPRISLAGVIRCLPLEVDAPDWTVDPRDHVPESEDSSVGAAVSNGVLTAQFLYLVVLRVGGHTLLKIRVYDLLDGETVVQSAGAVVSTVNLTTLVASEGDLYRDNLVAVNRRLVGLSSTAFFEITT